MMASKTLNYILQSRLMYLMLPIQVIAINIFNNINYYINSLITKHSLKLIDDFKEGGAYNPLVGNEVSVNFAKCVGDPEYFFKYGEIELTEEESQ